MVPVADAHPDGQQEDPAGRDRHLPKHLEAEAAGGGGRERQLQAAERRLHRARATASAGEAGAAERDGRVAVATAVGRRTRTYGERRESSSDVGQSDGSVHGAGGDRGRIAKHQSRAEDAGATAAEQRSGQDVDGERAEQATRLDHLHGGERAEMRDGEERERRFATEDAVRGAEAALRERVAADLPVRLQARAESGGGRDIPTEDTAKQDDSAVQAAEDEERGVRGEARHYAGPREREQTSEDPVAQGEQHAAQKAPGREG